LRLLYWHECRSCNFLQQVPVIARFRESSQSAGRGCFLDDTVVVGRGSRCGNVRAIQITIRPNNSGSYETRGTSRVPSNNGGRSARSGGKYYFLEELSSMNRTHTEPSGAGGRAAESGLSRFDEQHSFFAGFTFTGNQDLEALAGFYGLTVPALAPRITLAEYLAGTCYGSPHPGYRIALGNVELIVQELEEGIITKVGLRLPPPAPRPHRRRLPLRVHYDIGASLVRPSRRLTGAAAR
jgi:hypothetical protein